MVALVTGVGYLGATVLARLLEAGETVVGLDNAFSTPSTFLDDLARTPGFTLVRGDVAEPDDVARAFDALPADEPVTVYHLAAQPSAAVAAQDPAVTERSNLVGARVLLEAARDHQARVVFGGSFRVYGDDLVGRTVDESAPYGRVGDLSHLSKIYVEQLGRMLGLPFVSVRLGVVYGIGPVMKDEPRFMTVPHVFSMRAARGDVLEVIEDRPMAFVHLDDAAEALLNAAELLVDGPAWQVANAAPEVLSVGAIARLVQSLAGQRDRFVRVQGASTEVGDFRVESRLDAGGFTYRHAMVDSLGPVLDYYLERSL